MLAVDVLFTSIDSMLVIEACSNSNCRDVAPNEADAAVAMRIPSILTAAYFGSRPLMRTARASALL